MKIKLFFAGLLCSVATFNAQVATINENFESFVTGTAATWPQNDWSRITSSSTPRVYADGTTDKYAQLYSFFFPGVAAYLVAPQIVAPDGTKSLKFSYSLTTGSGGNGTLQVGLISDNTTAGAPSFTAISPVYTVSSTTEQTVTISVPASSSQYIAFKFIGDVNHAAVLVDDVVYNTTSVLATSDSSKKEETIKFASNQENTALHFIGKTEIKNVSVYSATGQKAISGKPSNNTLDISTLQTGVYYVTIETKDGKAVKSKFIKK